MNSISSTKNPLVQAAKRLQSKAERDETGLFVCEGEHMAGEAIRAGYARTVFVDEKRLDEYAALTAGLECFAVPEHVLAAMSQVKAPQGVCAIARQPERAPLSALGSRVILLENVQDPGNVGTILRTLDAAGFTGCVLTPGCADPFSPKALRATMGSVFRVPLCFSPAADALDALNAAGFETMAAVLDGEPFYQRGETPERLCVLIGNEGAGLTAQSVARCKRRVRLPMRGGAESLNAAVAAAILMYDLMNR
ncbi:MAG: RNA methyltransferase [Eubacteriales bacterium]|nr:RNA methyltransferase [Eubacteriales bacterium]